MKIALSEIKIENRQRKEVGTKDFQLHVEELAASIKRFGLLNPITLNEEDNSLVAGFCRLMATATLGESEIEYRYVSQLSQIDRKELELEENVRRKNLEWYEEAAAIAEIHALKKAQDPNWTIEKTSAMLGKSMGSTSEAISAGEEMKKKPEIKKEKNATAAVRKIQLDRKLAARHSAQEIIRNASGGGFKAEILQGDARELIRKEPSESYDCVVSNLPFGVDLQLKNEGAVENRTVYRDDEDHIVSVVMDVVPEIYRVLKPDSWAVLFFDIGKITYSDELKKLKPFCEGEARRFNQWRRAMGLRWWLEEAGFSYVTPRPAIWVKPNKTQGIIGNPQKGMIVAYEAMLFAAKGEAVLLKQGRQNIFVFDSLLTSEREFALQMPQNLCKTLLDMVVLGGARVLDPFAGSGSFGLPALDKQCEFRGFELDEERARLGNTLLGEHALKKESD